MGDRQVLRREVHDLDVEGTVEVGVVGDPVADDRAEAALAVRAEDHGEAGAGGHGGSCRAGGG